MNASAIEVSGLRVRYPAKAADAVAGIDFAVAVGEVFGFALSEAELSGKSWPRSPAGTLSNGMQMRLKLARAILHRPDLLFLDEPTSGLDPAHAAEVRGIIREQSAAGWTVFLTTHDMAWLFVLHRAALRRLSG